MTPTVSIIMATYNRAHYILESLISIQNQTYKNWECLIIDDRGTDNTEDVIASILEQDSRFKYYRRIDKYLKGLPGSRNYGLDLAQGEYIIFFDDDDIAHPQNLELCLYEFNTRDISFCRYIRDVFTGSFHYNFDMNKQYSAFRIDRNDINKILKNELQFNSCAVMWDRACYATHRYTEHLKYAEEWELYARIITSVKPGVSINKALYYGRKHQSLSVTGDFNLRKASSLKSYTDAIELVLINLKQQHLLSDEMVRYFVQIALNYKDYDLFNRIMRALQLKGMKKVKWQLIYMHLPLRLYFYKLYKYNIKPKIKIW